MRALIALSVFLAGCSGDATAADARRAARAEIRKVLPQVTRFDEPDVTTLDMGEKWRVIYAGGTGGITVDVDKNTRQAEIVEIQQ